VTLVAGPGRSRLDRVAVISVHTSPLDQPGTGDAGGLNVYVVETAKRLAESGIEVDIFTRATASDLAPVVDLFDGVRVRHVSAGPFEGLRKEDLPGQLCAMTAGVLRFEATQSEGHYDLVHSHYWLSGQVGWLAAERWNVPLIHSMHTMGKVKNLTLAAGDAAEPLTRIIGEQQVIDAADRLVANTALEADQLTTLYGAHPRAVSVVHPGVDLNVFSPGSREEARKKIGLRADQKVLLFVGRIQPLKAPDVLLHAAAELVRHDESLREQLVVLVCGGPSGSGLEHPHALEELAQSLGIADVVRFVPPQTREALVSYYRAADLTLVPSYSESFGLVAVESQACGTPVVAAAVGGLRTAVAHDRSGVLVDSHDPHEWAHVLVDLLASQKRRDELSIGATAHASRFGWSATTSSLIDVYRSAIDESACVDLPVQSERSVERNVQRNVERSGNRVG
jgi:D-inositol-3-phosphate glycosyltransferase